MNADLRGRAYSPHSPYSRGRLWLAGLPLLLASFGALAGDLLEVYHQAQARDPAYSGAVNALRAARERVPQARAGLLPAVSLMGATSQQSGQASFSEAPYVGRNVRNRSWNLQLTQPLWRATSWAALDQAGQQEMLAEAQFRQAEQELILRTAQAYLDVLVAQEAERVARLQVGAVTQQLELARRNFEVGTGIVTDVHEAQSRLDLSRSQAVAAGGELKNKRAELVRIIGESRAQFPAGPPQGKLAPSGGREAHAVASVGAYPLARLRADSRLPGIQLDGEQAWLDSAREQSIQVRIAQATLEVADREIAKGRAAHSPTLDLTAGYGSNYSSGSITSPADISVRSRSGQVGLNLNIPLFAGGGVQARVREALALRDKVSDDLEAARRQAVTQASQAFTGVVSGAAQVEALASAIASSKSAVDSNKIGFRVGSRINIDVLNAEQQLYTAQRDWHKARAETLMQGLRLKAANATLAEADLNAINDLLETGQP
ncbi:MAG: TolC family protein [Polaromonas sp.]|uniref:TolC family protein n=1 Tax=Polaromonas sp. TaxID=1869339 RepID=UPI0027333311|nr:TolC family protein [Polaromonas sp.]MDP3798209.1 TolC family protein [Polaromonas sp.]